MTGGHIQPAAQGLRCVGSRLPGAASVRCTTLLFKVSKSLVKKVRHSAGMLRYTDAIEASSTCAGES